MARMACWLLVVVAVLALAGCEDEDGKQRSIAAIVIRQVIFAPEPPSGAAKASSDQLLVAEGFDWQTSACLVGESGFIEFAPGVETLAVPADGEIALRLAVTDESAAFQLALYEDTGAGPVLVAWGEAGAAQQCVNYAPQTGAVYTAAIYCAGVAAPSAMCLTCK